MPETIKAVELFLSRLTLNEDLILHYYSHLYLTITYMEIVENPLNL